jgi:DNA-binding response OmpR family regulator
MAHILLIEPDVVLARTYAAAMTEAGHEVQRVTTAQAAINAADTVSPDVVLLEFQLVSHSGIEFLYEFRSYTEWQMVPVIILSNVPLAEFAASKELLRLQLGVQVYHYKPHTSLAKLLQSIEDVNNTVRT